MYEGGEVTTETMLRFKHVILVCLNAEDSNIFSPLSGVIWSKHT